ncbi:conserved hypothetical protein [Crenothrix polyspora]|uniref:Uncharacterized protein n=2 Tax=Crenothrix polyspora TaxID=360316 RepID=A0A1R4H6J3_9GAMM|nr:conserved hypothetical protein [Crenothrix polyspora]
MVITALRYNLRIQKVGFLTPSLSQYNALDKVTPKSYQEIERNMNKVNVAVVRLVQFVVFVVFTFIVMAYFGAIILLPLDAIALLIKLMGVVGLHGFIGALIAIPAVGYLVLMAYKTPGLGSIVIETGLDLVATGKAKIEAFNAIASNVKG